MKKIPITVFISLIAFGAQAQAQENFDPFKDRDFIFDAMHIGTMIIVIYLISSFILQWFFMLLAIGLGLLLVKIVSPFGLHSLAILALSIAAGFGAYYYFSRQTDKE